VAALMPNPLRKLPKKYAGYRLWPLSHYHAPDPQGPKPQDRRAYQDRGNWGAEVLGREGRQGSRQQAQAACEFPGLSRGARVVFDLC